MLRSRVLALPQCAGARGAPHRPAGHPLPSGARVFAGAPPAHYPLPVASFVPSPLWGEGQGEVASPPVGETNPRPLIRPHPCPIPFAKREVATNGWRGGDRDIRVAGYRPRTKRGWTTAGGPSRCGAGDFSRRRPDRPGRGSLRPGWRGRRLHRPPAARLQARRRAGPGGATRPKRRSGARPLRPRPSRPDRVGEALSHQTRTTRSGMEPRRRPRSPRECQAMSGSRRMKACGLENAFRS